MQIKEGNMEQIILETAEKLFLEKGFDATSTTMIAREVGCNQALVHYYFRTKDNLFHTIFEKKFKGFFQQLFDLSHLADLPFQEKIRRIIELHFDLIAENPKFPALMVKELSRQPDQITVLKEKLRALPEQMIKELEQELQNEIEAGRIRAISLLDLLVTMVSMNIAMFVMMPMVEKLLELSPSQKRLFIQHRRKQNVDFILNSLRP